MAVLRVGVWGVGVWGEKHARIWRALASHGAEVELVGVHDQSAARAAEIAALYDCEAFPSAEGMLRRVEAVSIAVPTIGHRAAAETALGMGCHVLVEKPLAVTTAEADSMLAAAQHAGRVLQVGQVERFNPALVAARARVSVPKFIEAHRLALFQPRSLDIDVVFDLMIHDVDIVLQIVGQVPQNVSAVGVAVLSQSEDIANARLEFPDGCVANLTASRVSQERLRRIRFFQSDAYVSVDLIERTGEVLRVDPRAAAAGPAAALAAIQRSRLEVPEGEPLRLELEAFARSLRGNGPGAASGWAGREALRVAEDVRAAMRRRSLQWTAG
jgi:predicted dehydrogenase